MKIYKNENENGKSALRVGTHCKFCGRPILAGERFVTADGGACGSVVYAHETCCHMRGYSFEEVEIMHKGTYSGFCWAGELETMTSTTFQERTTMRANYGVVCTSDSTVTEEFKMPIMCGLHGAKAFLNGVGNFIDLKHGDKVGTHINFSLSSWWHLEQVNRYGEMVTLPVPNAGINLRRADIYNIYVELAHYLRRELTSEERAQIFGRDFSEYSRYTDELFRHGDFLCIKDTCLELRIAKYQSTQQYVHLIALCKIWALLIDEVMHFTKTPEQAIKGIKKSIQNHLHGKATYQRPERNK